MFWCRRKQREQELEREILAHLELEAEEQRDMHAARRSLGNLTSFSSARTLFPVILTCSVICMKPDKSRVVIELRDSAYDLHSSPRLKGDRKPCDSL